MRESDSYYGATAHGYVTDLNRRKAHAPGTRVADTTLHLTSD
jgi:hypothetical protein